MKQTSVLIASHDHRHVGSGLERLRSFVRRARPGRREVADHLIHLANEIQSLTEEATHARVLDSLLTYLMRSPRLAPDYVESLTEALFARFRLNEEDDLVLRDLVGLEDALALYLDVAARRPALATTHFKSKLEHHLHTFLLDDMQRLHALADDKSPEPTARTVSTKLALEFARPTTGLDLYDVAHSILVRSEYAAVVFWVHLIGRVSETLPGLVHHPLLRTAETLRARLRKSNEATARKLEHAREFERVKAEVRDWRRGLVAPDRAAAHRDWVFVGRPNERRYWTILVDRRKALMDRGDVDAGVEFETEGVSRARLAAKFPVDSPAHRNLLQFAGPNVRQVDRGSRALPVPPALRALAAELPDSFHFHLARHYDEHVWERAEGRRSSASFLKRRPPEYVVDLFERLLGAIKDADRPDGTPVRPELRNDVTEFLTRIKEGLARDGFETTAWSVAKRNEMLESLDEAEWRVLEGKASHPSNVLLQADVRGTRFNLAVCVREPCTGDLRVGGVASIYPVCGPGVFLVPRASKIARTLDRLADPAVTANKEFRLVLVGARPCPK